MITSKPHAFYRAFLIIIVYLTFTPVHWTLLRLNTNLGRRFGRLYLHVWGRALGFRVEVKGAPSPYKPTLHVANHISYTDILILGGILPGLFVAKHELRSWPIFGFLATQQGTLYIDRSKNAIYEGIKTAGASLDEGESLILFPEGTTSDGCRVLPFGSSFFGLALEKDIPVQPITITYLGWEGMPMPHLVRKLVGWFSLESELMPHLWQMFQLGRMQVSIEYHDVIFPTDFKDRKALANASRDVINQGLFDAFVTPVAERSFH